MRLRPNLFQTAVLLSALALGMVQPARAFDDQGLKVLTQKIASKLGSAQKNSIAVVDFVNLEGGTTLLGRFLAEEVANGLGNSERNFEIVDRNHLNSIMKEHKLSSTGFIDKLTTSTLGSMTGAQALVIGTITPLGDSLRVTIKVLDTKTAKQMVSDSVEFPKTKALEDMYGKALAEDESKPAAKKETQVAAQKKKAEADDEEDSEPNNLIEVQGVRFELASCSRGAQTITCRLNIQSASKDLEVFIGKATRIFDQNGGEFGVSEGKIANGGTLPGCCNGDAFLGKKIVAGVKTPVSLVFHDVTPAPRLISSMELAFSLNRTMYEGEEKKISFRNVAVGSGGGGGMSKSAAKNAGDGGDAMGSGQDDSLLGTAIDTTKEEMKSLLKGAFGKLKKKAKIPDPSPGDSNKQ